MAQPTKKKPKLTIARILRWADAHHASTGRWPSIHSGEVAAAPRESWGAVNMALRLGSRGLPGGMTLSQLLSKHRSKRPRYYHPPRLTIRQILAWADAHHARTGDWPTRLSGPVLEDPHETWCAIDAALRKGFRGLPAGPTLAEFLHERRGRQVRLLLTCDLI